MVEEYWQRCDPLWIDGEGAESFSKVLERVRTLARISHGNNCIG
jgi:hypothetical protein